MEQKTIVFAFFLFCSSVVSSAAASCDLRPPGGRAEVRLPLHPYMVATLEHSCVVLVTVSDDGEPARGAIVVLKPAQGNLAVSSALDLPTEPVGIVLSRDESVAAVAGSSRIYFLDLPGLLAGQENPLLGVAEYEKDAGTVSLVLTTDERLLFASDEQARKITVIDFAAARASRFVKVPVLSRIPVDYAPTVLELTPDGKHVLVPVQGVRRDLKPPILCPGSPGGEPVNPVGAILSIDVAQSMNRSAGVMPTRSYAGCSPVRLRMTRDGRTAFVTNRAENLLRVMDVSRIVNGDLDAGIAEVAVGPTPIGVVLVDRDRLALVSNSNRWAQEQKPQTLDLVDVSGRRRTRPVVLGKISVGVFPRDLAISGDGRIVIVSNFGSDSLTLLDVSRLRRLIAGRTMKSATR